MNDPLDTRIKKELKARWPETPAAPKKTSELLNQLKTFQENPRNMKSRLLNSTRTFAGAALLGLLIVTLALVLDAMPPAPATVEGSPAADTTGLPSEAISIPTPISGEEATQTASPAPTAPEISPPSAVVIFPNVSWDITETLPDSPEKVTLFRQAFPPEASEAAARETAALLGVNGPVTSYFGEGNETIYQVTDGVQTMIFLGFEGQFTFFRRPSKTDGDPLPFEVRKEIAEDFLTRLGLLGYPYRAEPDLSDPNAVRFVQLLDGLPLVYGLGMNPGLLEWITVSVDQDGQVSELYHSLHDFQAVQDVEILSAEEAWARFAGAAGETRSQYAVLAAPMLWTQPDVALEETLIGWLTTQDERPILFADDGRTLFVADVPADLPPDVIVRLRGTVVEGTVRWGEIFIGGPSNGYGSSWSCGGGGGGGGGPFEGANFGGGQFALLNLGEQEDPSPIAPYVSPLAPGDEVSALEGILYLSQHTNTNGNQQLEATLWYAGNEDAPGWTGTLEGFDVDGLLALHNLPVVISGSVVRLNEWGMPVIQVTALEAAYPGVRIEAFIGIEEVVTVEGNDVLLLTTDSGEQYVIEFSIEYDAESLVIGQPGDRVIHEGYLLPGRSFGGYPVLRDLAGGIVGSEGLDGYEMQSTRIGTWDESGGTVNQAAALTGQVSIRSVELVYTAVSLGRCSPEFLEMPGSETWLYVQPVWRFLGTFEDGRTIEILVQALPDGYLR